MGKHPSFAFPNADTWVSKSANVLKERGVQKIVFMHCTFFLCFRQVLFDLAVEGEPFIEGLDSLEKAIASFFHVCFVANMQYPKVELANIVVICSLFFGALLDLFSAADPDPKYFTHKNGQIDDN